jgi:hypothetical protein
MYDEHDEPKEALDYELLCYMALIYSSHKVLGTIKYLMLKLTI